MRLDEAVAIVTGGASGLGKGIAKAICEAGGCVLLTDIDDERGSSTLMELQELFGRDKVAYHHLNVGNLQAFPDAFDVALNLYGREVNLLVNNAGISGDGSFFDKDCPLGWTQVIDIDLTAVIRGTQVAMQRMQRSGGVIINLTSMAGVMPMKQIPVYSAAKHGVVGLTRSLASYGKLHGIRVNALAPAFADTVMGRESLQYPEIAAYVEDSGGLIPVSRVIRGFVDLVEDDSITGKVLTIANAGSTIHSFRRAKL